MKFNFENKSLNIFIKLLKITIFILVFHMLINNITYDRFKRIQYNLSDNIHNIDDNMKIIKFNINGFDKKKINIYLIELKLANRSDQLNLKLFLNHSLIKDKDIKKGTETIFIEFDNKILREENILKISSNHNKWSIIYLKAKNIYGYSKGLLSFIIINKNKVKIAQDWIVNYPSFKKFIYLLFIFSFSIISLITYDKKAKKSILVKSILLVFLFLLFFSIIIPLITKYKIIYSISTFSFLLIIILFSYLNLKGFNLKKLEVSIPVVIFFIFLLFVFNDVQKGRYKYNFSKFIKIKRKYFDKIPQDKIFIPAKNLVIRKSGYDSQFFYYISFDPFLIKLNNVKFYRGFIDSPRYRYSRIGFPLLINLFSLGNKEIFPEIMMLLILFSHLFAVFYLMKIIKFYQKNPYLAFFYLAIPGFIFSSSYALPESIAGAFFIAGYYYYLKKKPIFYILSFAFSILIRETLILFLIIFALWELVKKRNWKIPVLLGSSIIPFFFWKVYLTVRLFSVYGFSTFFHSPKDTTYPFLGFYHLYKQLYLGIYKFKKLYAIGFIYPILLTIIFFLSIKLISQKFNFLHLVLLSYSIAYMSLNFEKIWCHMGNGIRGTYDIFLILIFVYTSKEDKRNSTFFIIILLLLIALNIFNIKYFL